MREIIVPAGIRLRRARDGDLAGVAALSRRILRSSNSLCGLSSGDNRAPLQGQLRRDPQEEGLAIFVAENREGRLVGKGALDSEGWLKGLYVSPAAQGTGIGSALLARIRALAKERGRGKIRANASVTSARFYARMGYLRKGGRLVGRTRPKIPTVLFEKDLSAWGS